MPEWSVYIVRCMDGSLYTGIATNVRRRIAEHVQGDGRGAKYLRGKGPLRLVFAKAIGSRALAQRAESRIKRLPKARKEDLIARRAKVRRARWVLLLGALLAGCSGQGGGVPAAGPAEYKDCALRFVTARSGRDYAAAYAMTSRDFRESMSGEHLQEAFETIIPTDWKTPGPVQIGHAMADRPERRPGDVGWAYVSVAGDVYSEAVSVVVARESGELRVRAAEFGRP